MSGNNQTLLGREPADAPAELSPVGDRRAGVIGRLLRDPSAVFGLALIALLVATALLAPVLPLLDPRYLYDDGLSDSGAPLGHTARFLLGTDSQGRDVLSRLLWGARTSLTIAAVSMAVTAVIGMLAGSLAGYFRGWVEVVLMRLTDILLSFPPALLAMALAAAIGSGLGSVILVVALVAWPPLARTVYTQVLSLREREFVEAARALGAGNWRIVRAHLVPQVLPLVLVYITLGVATAVSLEATLSFLGLGVPLTDISWGVMINLSLDYYLSNSQLLLFPALAIVTTVLAFTLVGEGLRRALAR
ncbi:MAG TPA: ABC transporter permease [Chloroflexota bacterium]|nr:ABC transporter permease [Chloroflexota bacterium]